VPASRVEIANVEPGTTTLARGEMLQVSADVHGVGEADPVVVRYTTADGQAVEKAVTMKGSESGLHFTAQLPAPTEPGRPTGVSQNLRYLIEAGDARSHVYSVTVVAAPTITVTRVDYEYPAYTGYANRSIDGLGDIRAIEGTRVTIHAEANSPIQDAAIDFEADGRRDVRMTVDGNEAQASFVLGLRDDHQTAKYKSYAVRFTGTDGRANRDPVKYPIDVLPDYAPEASIVAPAEKTRDIRLDETVPIAVDARDPDFALSEVRLKGDAAGHTVLDEPLLSKEHTGRFTGRLQFTPSEHGLKAGDVMQYWVVARDNRKPQANEAASEPQTLRIEPAGSNQQQPPDRLAKRDKRPHQPGDQQQGQPQSGDNQGNQQQQPSQGGGQSADGRQQSDGQQPAGGKSGEQQDGQQKKDDQSQDSQGDKSDKNQSKDGSSSGKQQGDGQSSQQNQQNQGKDSQQQRQPGGSESGGGHDKSQKQSGKPSAGGSESGDKDSQSGQSSGNQNQSGKQSNSKGQQRDNGDGKEGTPNDQKNSNGGSSSKGGHENVKPSESPSSQVSPEGDNDGEAFDRIQEFLQKQGELRDPSGKDKKPQDGQQSAGDKQGSNQKSDQGQLGSDKPSTDKQPPADGKSGDQQKSADGKSGDATRASENAKSVDGKQGEPKQDGPKSGEQGQDATKGGQPKDASAKDAPKDGQPGKDANGSDKDGNSANKPGTENRPGEQQPDKSNNPQTPNGQPAQSSGETGGGDSTKHDQATPDTGQQPQSKDKWQQTPSKSDDKKSGKGEEPPSGGQSKKQSDSQGDQGGDQAGGGTQGGGQQSPHDGTGSSGQNQSADSGQGESTEHGKGDNSPSAGKDAVSKDATGQSGSNQPGNGSSQRDGQGYQPGGKPNDGKQPAGNMPGDKSGDKNSSTNQSNGGGDQSADGKQEGNKPGDSKPDDNKPGDQSNKGTDPKRNQASGKDASKDNSSTNKPAGKPGETSDKDGSKSPNNTDQKSNSQPGQSSGDAGQSSNNGTPGAPLGAGGPNKTDAKAPEADAANLEYARKQTDLVLETLSEQMKQKKVDKRLLDELGWSEQDLQKFIVRWQQLKEAAHGDTPAADAAQKELDEALRSLGLHHGTLQQGKVTEDSVRDLREGYHGPVPLEYQERLRAYNQGVSRAHKDGE
jgi:hypothetical protein